MAISRSKDLRAVFYGLGFVGLGEDEETMSARLAPLPKMSAQDFESWLAQMKRTKGWTRAECARQLGVAPNSITSWCENGAPRHIGLACMFLSNLSAPAKKDKAA
jgi:DNA-binding XRE family transcriptional regulator